MTSKVYVQLCKFGDIMSLLPLLHADFLAGQKPSLMVSAKYASLLDGVSYVDPIIFDGDPSNITEAVIQASKTGLQVVTTQVCGPADMVLENVYKTLKPQHAATDSWQKEQYRAASKWSMWRKQPQLVFDQRNKEREKQLINEYGKSTRGVVLVSTKGETCPFPYKRLLMTLLDGAFRRNFTIIDLDDIKGERIYDLLGLFDKAKVLIASDSALLHLAQASQVPVCALVNDRPSLWHGAAWRPRHIFYCRYRDFAARATELIDAIKNIGKPGCQFLVAKLRANPPDRVHTNKNYGWGVTSHNYSKRTWIHAWSAYDINDNNRDRHERAKRTWDDQYHHRNWISCPLELGAAGRDSKMSPIGDRSRYPFVRDVIQAAELRAKDDDVIVLTPSDVSFKGDIEAIAHFPAYGCRLERSSEGETYNPRPDFFAFTAGFWRAHRTEFPDMILGPDGYWSRTLKEFLRLHGAIEVENATFKEME